MKCAIECWGVQSHIFFENFFRPLVEGIRKVLSAIEIGVFAEMFQSHNRIVLLQAKSNFN